MRVLAGGCEAGVKESRLRKVLVSGFDEIEAEKQFKKFMASE